MRQRYLAISPDGCTPQLGTTRRQAEDLARRLAGLGLPAVPGMAMRYWHPYPEATVTDLERKGAQQYLILPIYPQYSCATNGSTLGFVLDGLKAIAPGTPVHVVPEWHLQPGFLAALAEPVIATLAGWADEGADPAACALLYAAHSLPQKMIDGGDPYLSQTNATVDAVHAAGARPPDGRRPRRLAGRPARRRRARSWPSRAGSAPSSGWGRRSSARSSAWPPPAAAACTCSRSASPASTSRP